MSTLVISNIKATGETASRAVSGVAAAWINFDGTGTVAIRDSVNAASLTDTGTGSYTISFTNSMAVSTYNAHANVNSADVIGNPHTPSTSSLPMRSYYPHGTAYSDPQYGWLSAHGDLA